MPASTAPKEAVAPVSESKPAPVLPPGIKGERKVATKPLLTHAKVAKSTEVSLKNLFESNPEPTEEEAAVVVAPVNPADLPKDLYSQEEFAAAWNNFCAVVKREDNLSVYATISVKVPAINQAHEIDLVLSGEYQLRGIQNVREQLLTYIRKALNNHLITVQTRIVKAESTQEKFYTDKDKFNALVQQNPELEKLRKALGLDVEF